MKHTVLIIAGEKSGDIFGGNIVKNFNKLKPNTYFFGTGGEDMRKAGVDLIYHVKQLSYSGYWDIIASIFDIKRKFEQLKKAFLTKKPDLVILIDFPGFNLAMAKFIKKTSPSTKIIYYIPPLVWLRKKYRINALKAFIDEIIVIFPIEVDFFLKKGMKVHFFGHPFYHKFVNFKIDKPSFCKQFGIDPHKTIITAGIGSRSPQLKYLAPTILKAIDIVKNDSKDCVFLITFADSLDKKTVDKWQTQFAKRGCVFVPDSKSAMAHSDLVVCNVGTIQLEATLLGKPSFSYFKTSWMNTLIAFYFYLGNFVTMNNLLLGEYAFAEHVIPWRVSRDVADEILKILADEGYHSLLVQKTGEIKKMLAHEHDHFEEVAKFMANFI